MEPEPQRPRRPWCRGEWLVLTSVGLVVVGLLLPAYVNLCQDLPARIYSQNHLLQMDLGMQNCLNIGGRLPPSAGPFNGRDGTFFYHLLPFVEEGGVRRRDDPTAVVGLYMAPGDPTLPRRGTFLSFASNFTVFGRTPRTLDEARGGRKADSVVCIMERYAVAEGHEHHWPDTDDGATWLVGGEAGFQIRPSVSTASNTDAQAFSRVGISVGMLDGSVRVLTRRTSQDTFRWLGDPTRKGPAPEDW